jgi:hypothetical protein
MTEQEKFITLVATMREAQRDFFDNRSRGALAVAKKYETLVDEFIEKHIAERVQFELWSRAIKTDEMPGAYNVDREKQAKEGGEA